ncbi:HAD hydrolase-like protein [Geodermatophilus sp. SYSU D01176]
MLVGDRAHDVLGAAAHGLPCIGAGWGPASPGELADAGARVVAATPAAVRTALDRMSG